VSKTIRIAAAVVLDDDGRILLVRKRGSDFFMQPGGKHEPGEGDLDALKREIREELGSELEAATASSIGRFRAPAANEPGSFVEASLYRVRLRGPLHPAGEIEELLWVDPKSPGDVRCAPLTRDVVLPMMSQSP
jgi:8-oxo-dGTP pyrophosphatase MutT (NUDIX family)